MMSDEIPTLACREDFFSVVARALLGLGSSWRCLLLLKKGTARRQEIARVPMPLSLVFQCPYLFLSPLRSSCHLLYSAV